MNELLEEEKNCRGTFYVNSNKINIAKWQCSELDRLLDVYVKQHFKVYFLYC